MKNTKVLCAFLLLSSLGIMASQSEDDRSSDEFIVHATEEPDSRKDPQPTLSQGLNREEQLPVVDATVARDISLLSNRSLLEALLERVKGPGRPAQEGDLFFRDKEQQRFYRIGVEQNDSLSLTEEQITSQPAPDSDPKKTPSSWIPTRRTVAYGAAAATAAATAVAGYCFWIKSGSGINPNLSL